MRYPIPYAGNARTRERALHALVCAALGRARVVKVRGVVMAKRTPEICEPCLEAVTNKWPQGLKHFFPSFPMAIDELCTTTNGVSKTILRAELKREVVVAFLQRPLLPSRHEVP